MSSAKELEQLFRHSMPLFIALGDEVRLSIIEALGLAVYEEHQAGRDIAGQPQVTMQNAAGLNVNEITRQTCLSRPAVSHHLKILKDAGLIGMRQSGTCNYYYLTLKESTEQLTELVHMLKDFIH